MKKLMSSKDRTDTTHSEVFIESNITDFSTFVYLDRLSEVAFPALLFTLFLILSFEPP